MVHMEEERLLVKEKNKVRQSFRESAAVHRFQGGFMPAFSAHFQYRLATVCKQALPLRKVEPES